MLLCEQKLKKDVHSGQNTLLISESEMWQRIKVAWQACIQLQ